MVIAAISVSSNLSNGHMFNYVEELSVFKFFKVGGHRCKASTIRQVVWHSSLCNWVKYNIDGAVRGFLGMAACGGIFRDYRAATLGCFASNLGILNSFSAELNAAMYAIEIASNSGWCRLWLESDFELVVKAFTSKDLVPGKLQNRWLNCMQLVEQMNFRVSHIFHEGNICADKLLVMLFII